MLIVNHFAMAPDMGGGTRHVELGSELTKRGWVVTIMSSDFHLYDRHYLRRSNAADRSTHLETIDGVRFRWLHTSAYERNDALRVANWLSFGRAALGERFEGDRPDVVLGSSPHLFAALAAWRIARRFGVPFVLEVRDLWPESLAVNGRRRRGGYWTLWAISRFLYLVADRIIVLAQGAGEYLCRLRIDPARIAHIPNGADLSQFNPLSPRRGEEIRLVYAGAHGPANGLETVLAAAWALRSDSRISFLFVGDGPSKVTLLESAQGMGLTNVRFGNSVAKRDIPELLARCDAGIMVLKDVALFSFGVSPNKLFDYWSAGLPVVCNVRGEVADLVRESAGGIQAADGSPAALAVAIRELVALSPDARRAMGESGRRWVMVKRNRSLLAGQLDSLLSRLVQDGDRVG
ncbi:MAG: glycosyltransferase family 4 protein [Gemmatimonadaceae bacterium]